MTAPPPTDSSTSARASTSGLPDAATVLLVRDGSGDGALEVFVVERQNAGAFAGILAFPGGKVDPADQQLPADRWTGLDLDEATARWGLGRDVPADRARLLGWHVAAVREAFEEVGVLLAHRATSGAPVTADDLDAPAFTDARARLVERGAPWDWTPWLVEQDLVLDLGDLGAWSRWITPEGEPRRFDTAFFVAQVPTEQREALAHDEVEVVASRWCTVEQILAERAAGTSVVIYPTRRQLGSLPTHAAAVLDAARAQRLDPVQPVITIDDEGVVVAHHPFDGTVEPVF